MDATAKPAVTDPPEPGFLTFLGMSSYVVGAALALAWAIKAGVSLKIPFFVRKFSSGLEAYDAWGKASIAPTLGPILTAVVLWVLPALIMLGAFKAGRWWLEYADDERRRAHG